jgi:hypothetical protein
VDAFAVSADTGCDPVVDAALGEDCAPDASVAEFVSGADEDELELV